MRPLSKSKLLAFRQCPKKLWLELHGPKPPKPDAQTQARFDDGHDVGGIAQRLYDPKGKGTVFEPAEQGYDEVIMRTDEEIESFKPLFEAGFNANGARAYVDAMLPVRRGGQRVWRMVEVKSTTEVKETHRDDIAIQAYIARASGVELHSTSVAHIDANWKYPGSGDYQGFLTEVDLTDEALGREEEVQQWIARAQTVANKRKEPKVDVGRHCTQPYECAFIGHCQRDSAAAKFPIEWLPGGKSAGLRDHVETNGTTDLRHVPDDCLNAKQLRVKKHTLSGDVYFDAAAASKALAHLKFPALFLDFESINLTIPIWKGTSPFQQIPFQFSLHRLSHTGKLTHQEFLDLSGKDPSRKIAEALIAACGERGPIFVYSSFERTRIRDLAKRFPKLARSLQAIDERLVDLLPIAQDHYYHPDQQGSWSIKNVLPTVAPDLLYEELDGVQNGGMAVLAFREAIDPTTTAARKDEIKRQLLDYCGLDTYAMVKLWQFFSGRNDIRI